ncbi:MAG: YIP1 family protein [Halanaerobiales bacterium]
MEVNKNFDHRKLIIISLLFICFFVFYTLNVEARAPYESYTYNFWGKPVSAPQAYIPENVYNGEDLDVGSFENPRDLYITSENMVYLLDTGNNRVLVFNEEWENINIIEEFEIEDTTHTMNNPRGIFVDENNDELYVADTDNSRVLIFDTEGSYLRKIDKPETGDGILTEDFKFQPRKVAVNPAGRIYVVATDVYDGIMQFDNRGNFMGFVGAPEVSPDPIDMLWRYISTEEQMSRRNLYLPISYSSIDVDEKGLLLATEQGPAGNESVKRINTAGADGLARRGFHNPQGDLVFAIRAYQQDTEDEEEEEEQEAAAEGEDTLSSTFVDISGRSGSRYSVLDSNRGRVFTYDSSGNLLYVFGGPGRIKGLSNRASALGSMGEKMVVIDASGYINVYRPTEYALNIHQAIDDYDQGRYDQSVEQWREVLKLNSNYDQAYQGIGLSYLRQDDFENALFNFRIGQHRDEYSTTFQYYRREVITERFTTIVWSLLFVIILLILIFKFNVIKRVKSSLLKITGAREVYEKHDKESKTQEVKDVNESSGFKEKLFLKVRKLFVSLKYSLYVIFHPASGFWDLKHQKKGNLTSASIIFMLVAATYVFMRQYTGFVFNVRDWRELNIVVEFLSVFIPFILWCIVNWALTTLMEGKGTFKEIIIASAYSLTPIILIYIPLTVISNYLTLEEAPFYYFFVSGAMFWALGLLIMSTMVTHEYTMLKTLFTSILIILGMVIVLFLIVLFISVINQLFVFIYQLYLELSFR